MRSIVSRRAPGATVVMSAFLSISAASAGIQTEGQPERAIVVLRAGASAGDVARSHGVAGAAVFRHALRAFAAPLDVYRNSVRIATTANDRAYSDSLGKNVRGSFGYRVCEQASSICSPTVTVTF